MLLHVKQTSNRCCMMVHRNCNGVIHIKQVLHKSGKLFVFDEECTTEM